MTGCPNGCARPYNSDIGLVGKTKDKYTIFLGGRVLGDRLNFIYKDLVPTSEVVPTLACRCCAISRKPAKTANLSAISATAWIRTPFSPPALKLRLNRHLSAVIRAFRGGS